ncbi:pyridoxamine 5'-phosphate oxidase family protein [Vibrio sp. SCSIO 43136]|uniref:pyridoxamine 5'-phosphate oxidase family protein n=1 Tax=Vibrio sp. SCSIO 43136 TaxID=2819101 RepID=UPI002075016A|nr:pyridoxamine 5'-phosphate oxidase family protein [Vibrio sp. SCSIO 43136]USD67195.1 pyridoxamine 5'-phosphate oxidase family protein [Vibrio sp. SCSIO 43136]
MLGRTKRTEINKGAHKASFEPEQLHRIIDESLLGHIAFADQEQPMVIPMLVWRVADHIYVHGANNSRLMRVLKSGQATCVTFTLFDGWVLARSAFHHSAHYRSAVVLGHFEEVSSNQIKDQLLNHFIDQIAPGRSEQVRASEKRELAATTLLKMPLTEASVKISNNNVNDEPRDMNHPVWAGILPYRTKVGPLIDDPDLLPTQSAPDYSSAYGERWKDS